LAGGRRMNNKLYPFIGLKVIAVRSYVGLTEKGMPRKRLPYCIEPEYIMFDDEKTFIELEEQDYYSYHDCSSGAREVRTTQDTARWKRIMEDAAYADANEEL
jgi:hypothetical protein